MRKAKAGVALALLVAASLGVGYLAENPSRETATSTPTYAGSPWSLPVTDLGNFTTIDQARQIIGVNFSSPTFTPSSTTLSQVRAREGVVALVYDNPSLPN